MTGIQTLIGVMNDLQVSGDMSIFRFISVWSFRQKCHMNMGLILTGHGAVYLMCCSSSAHVHGGMDVFKLKPKKHCL